MRWFTSLMAIVLTALFLLPCTDDANSCSDSKEVLVSQLTHSHGLDNGDRCSPFCQCACCGLSSVSFQLSLPSFHIPNPRFVATDTSLRDLHFVSNYLGSIWRPPMFNA